LKDLIRGGKTLALLFNTGSRARQHDRNPMMKVHPGSREIIPEIHSGLNMDGRKFELNARIMPSQKSPVFPFSNVLLLVAVNPFAAWFSYKNLNYQVDDALIYLRYIRNLFDGYGLTYNAGERFNGLTSPLYSYLLIAANSITHSLQYTTIFLSFVFFCGAAIYGSVLVSDNRIEQALCGLFVVLFNYFYSTFGMETALFLFLTALGLYFYKNNHLFLAGITIALLILTRTEGVFLGTVIFIHYTFTQRRILHVKYLAVPAMIMLANFLFNYFYYGSPLPATGTAKIGQGKSGYWGDGYPFLNVEFLKNFYFGGSYRQFLLLIPATVFGIIARRRLSETYLIVSYLIILGGFYVFLRIPGYHWYYAPFLYFLMLFSAVGAWQVISRLVVMSGRQWMYWFALVPAGFMVILFLGYNFMLSSVGHNSSASYRNIGNWLDSHTPARSAVATVEIGTIGWYSHRHIIDILGLVNPYNADFVARKNLYLWLTRYSPDYILIHDPPWVFEQSASCLRQSGAYVPVPDFNFPGYTLFEKSPGAHAAEMARACGYTP
jgi:hypothetical protein